MCPLGLELGNLKSAHKTPEEEFFEKSHTFFSSSQQRYEKHLVLSSTSPGKIPFLKEQRRESS